MTRCHGFSLNGRKYPALASVALQQSQSSHITPALPCCAFSTTQLADEKEGVRDVKNHFKNVDCQFGF